MSYPDAPMFPPFPPTQISNGSNRYPLPQSVPPTGESDAQPPFIISGNESDIQEVRADSQGLGSEAKARLRKACDSCSIRKVKCDENGPPCRACASLDIPCTYDRPSRRRGPPNRHADAIKKRRYDSPGTSGTSAPSSPTHAAHALASFSQHQVLSAETILPLSVLQLLLEDYFTYIHPLIPIPHEPSFRAALERREDLSNPTFLALLASMVGCLVASFPRRPRKHLKAQNMDKIFPNPSSLIDRCHKVAVEARGPGYLDRDLTVHDAVISYLQGLTSAYTYNWQSCRVYFGECLTISRIIGLHKAKGLNGTVSAGFSSDTNVNDHVDGHREYEEDLILRELGRRTFWILFVAVKSVQQLGASSGEFWLPPETPSEPYPPLPLEVNDEYLTPTHVLPQPQGMISTLAGFNANVKIYSTYNALSTMELAFGIDVFDWDRQKRVLEQSLHTVKRVLDDVPLELKLCPKTQLAEIQEHPYSSLAHSVSKSPRLMNYEADNVQGNIAARRRFQYNIQKANIYVSQLGTRSYLVEKYWNLYEARKGMKSDGSPNANSSSVFAPGLENFLPPDKNGDFNNNFDLVEQDMANEREEIIKDLLDVLGLISQTDIEPNGTGFMNKIRQIASTLLDVPHNRKGQYALRAEEYFNNFLSVLMKLEGSSSIESEQAMTEEEEEEAQLRHWADLREYQARFAKAGGF